MGRRCVPLLLLALLALLAGGCGREGPPPPPSDGVEIGPAEPAPWAPAGSMAAPTEPGIVYRMVDRADQLQAVLPAHNLPRDDAGAAISPERIEDRLDLSELTWTRDGEGDGVGPIRWSAPFPPASFPRFSGRWIGAADHGAMLELVVAGETLAHAGGQDARAAGTWAWLAGELWLVLPAGDAPPEGTVRLRHESLGHEVWHADLHGAVDHGFVVRSVALPAPEIDRSKPQQTLFEPMDRREAVYVPAPGQVADHMEVPAGAVLELACGLVLQPTFEPTDGVVFSGLFVGDQGLTRELFRLELDPERFEDRGWHDVAVDLGELAGRTGELRLSTEPRGDPRLALAAFAHPRLTVAGGTTEPAPSVLLVMVDTLRADTLRGEQPVAPWLREMADGGLEFADTVSPAPWTTPAVISVFSGLYPRSHQGNAKQIMRNGAPSLAEEVRGRGYSTWALLTNPALRDAGIDRGFEELLFHKDWPADRVTDRAIEWLARRPDQPFLAYVHYMDPHTPYLPHPELTGWDGAAPRAVTAPEAMGRQKILEWETTTAGRDWMRRRYEEEVRFVDHHLGRLVDAGARDGWGAHTVVVIVSDHGEELWDHGGFEHGHTFHRELLDVVLLIRPATSAGDPPLRGGLEGSVTARPASLIDVRPTVLGLLGAEASTPCQGLDLLGDDFPRDRSRFSEANLYGEQGHAVAQGSRRLQQQGQGPARLYDLEHDPGEHRDVSAGDPVLVNVLQRQFEVEHQLQCDTIRDSVDARSTDAPDPHQLDLATRRALELLGYIATSLE